jgi:hypothetical protein
MFPPALETKVDFLQLFLLYSGTKAIIRQADIRIVAFATSPCRPASNSPLDEARDEANCFFESHLGRQRPCGGAMGFARSGVAIERVDPLTEVLPTTFARNELLRVRHEVGSLRCKSAAAFCGHCG